MLQEESWVSAYFKLCPRFSCIRYVLVTGSNDFLRRDLACDQFLLPQTKKATGPDSGSPFYLYYAMTLWLKKYDSSQSRSYWT